MQNRHTGLTRREFLKAVGLGALGTVAAGWASSGMGRMLSMPTAMAATTTIALAATDGYITMPGRDDPNNPADPIYIFGFVPVDPNASVSTLIANYKGHAQHTAPILSFRQNDDIKITLTNLGLVQRPDLTDSHTIHWHGFDIPSPLNDGVPEVSVAVPIGKQLTYFYRPHREGTYMYHCHFEDVEHVQMGMTSIVFVRPLQDGTPITVGTPSGPKTFTKFAYNDTDGSTGYDRHFAMLMNETWSVFHDHDRDIQETIMTDYDPQWFTLNGRCYPQTVLLNDDPPFPVAWLASSGTTSGLITPNPNYGTNDKSQPNSSLIQVNPNDRVLFRLANLGYQQHAMELPGITMHVVGQDASLLRNGGVGGVDTSYFTNTLYIGPGEARDVLFDAPAYDAARPSGSDAHGSYNVYYFKNRDWRRLSNNGAPGPGGMMTEVRVYQDPLPAQTIVNQTYS
jgi:FtsP/CotA-like multicopper oxidase with cupredoxin domain